MHPTLARASAWARDGGSGAATPTSVLSRTRFPKTEAQIVTVSGPREGPLLVDVAKNVRVIHSALYNLLKWSKSAFGKVVIPVTIRMIIKLSCVVAAIDQLVLVLSISKIQNLGRNIRVLHSRRYFIKSALLQRDQRNGYGRCRLYILARPSARKAILMK